MIVLRTHHKQVGEYQQYLKDCNVDYVIKTTTNSTTIEYKDDNTKYKIMFTDGQYMSIKEMILQKKLKKEVKERTENKQINYNGERIDFYRFDSSLKYMVDTAGDYIEFTNILEMDITKAYYKMALNLGYISEKTYKVCLVLPKYIRLRLIGSIATSKIIETYKNKELVKIEVKEDEQLRQIWFHICYNVGKIMLECAESIEDYFIFYWVDGIYFQRNMNFGQTNDPSIQIIKNIFQKNKLEYSVNQLERITLQNYNDELILKCWKNGEVKSNFSVPHKKVRKYVFDDDKQTA
jgi:hypothetical protein